MVPSEIIRHFTEVCYCNEVKIASLDELEAVLQPYNEVSQQTAGKHITLRRTERLMSHIGNPEKKLKVVHIAGTSGKTSTTYFISALLAQAGCKVGSTISPYVDTINERIQINGAPLPIGEFCRYFGEFVELLDGVPEVPSRWEVLIAFAYWVFAKERVDYAVVETGMGGLDDSTNVAARADKLCVLTDIGMDHMEQLGNTIEKIAYQKAGIIHEGNTAIMYDQAPEIMQVVRYWVSQQEGAELLTFEQEKLASVAEISLRAEVAEYQKRNWLLAYAAYKWLQKRDKVAKLSATQLQNVQMLQVPGRMDSRELGGKTILMDGAHNGQKMTAFWDSFAHEYPGCKPVVLLALKEGKEIADIVPLLRQYASQVIVTTFVLTQDMPIVAMNPSEISSVLEAKGVKTRIVTNASEAYLAFLGAVEKVGVITGSFYLIAQLRRAHKELSETN